MFFPMTLVLGMLVIGLFLLLLTRRQKTGKILVLIGTVLLGLMSYDGISGGILRPLEYNYPPILNVQNIQTLKWVVVLGGGHTSDPKIPVTGQLSEASLFRLVEAIRLHRELPQSKLILSGGIVFGRVSEAKVLTDVALVMGANKENLILEESSKDTEDQARLIQRIVGNERFVLVTSASHMPRCMALFKRLGMDPIPAPGDYQVKESQEISPGNFYPSASNIEKAERAFYEYLGLAWAKLRGAI